MLGIREAAALAGRHPETVRRWVWSGRLPARRDGNRLLVTRSDLEAIAGRRGAPISLATWAERSAAARDAVAGAGTSSAALVLEDRADRSRD